MMRAPVVGKLLPAERSLMEQRALPLAQADFTMIEVAALAYLRGFTCLDQRFQLLSQENFR